MSLHLNHLGLAHLVTTQTSIIEAKECILATSRVATREVDASIPQEADTLCYNNLSR